MAKKTKRAFPEIIYARIDDDAGTPYPVAAFGLNEVVRDGSEPTRVAMYRLASTRSYRLVVEGDDAE